jgi:hypothetical protein
MENVEGIYIINGKGQLIFSYEISDDRPNKFDYANISRFFSVIKTFALNIGEKEAKVIELGNRKIFKTAIYDLNVEFIIKCEKIIKEKKVLNYLNDLMNLFLNTFIGYFNSLDSIKKQKMDLFIQEFHLLFGKGGKISYFLKHLKIST